MAAATVTKLDLSTDFYRQMLENLMDTVLLCDRQGNLLFICPNIKEIWGYSAPQNFATIDQIFGQEFWPKILPNPSLWHNFFWSIIDAKGQCHDLFISLKPVAINGDNYLLSCREVTHYQQEKENFMAKEKQYLEIKQQLQSQNEDMQAIFAVLPDLLFRLDHEGRYLDFKAGDQQKLYVKPEQFLGKKNVEILPQEIAININYNLRKALEINTITSHEYALEINHKNYIFEARIIPIFDKQEVILIARDITEHHEKEAAYRETNQRFQAIFEQATVGIVILNHHGKFLQYNSAYGNILGYSPYNPVTRHCLEDLLPEITLQEYQQKIADMIAGKIKTYSQEHLVKRADGQFSWVSATLSPIQSDDDQQPSFMLILQDIEQRKMVKQQLLRRINLDAALAQISRQLISSNQIEIDNLLQLFGEILKVSRIYISQFTENNSKASVIYEWTIPNVKNWKDVFQNVPMESVPWWQEQLGQNKVFIFTNINDLPSEALIEKAYLLSMDVSAFVTAPIYDHKKELWGAIGYDIVGHGKLHCSPDDAQIIRMIGEMIYSYLDRRSNQKQLQASEALYSSIFNHSAEAIFLIKVIPNKRFIYEAVNPVYSEKTGIPVEKIINKSPETVFPPALSKSLIESFQRCCTIKETLFYEEELVFSESTQIWRTVLIPIRDIYGNITKLQGSSRDITQERKAAMLQMHYARYQHLLASLTLKIRESWQVEHILETTVLALRKTLQADRVIFWKRLPDGTGKVINESISPRRSIVDSHSYSSMLNTCISSEKFDYFLKQQRYQEQTLICPWLKSDKCANEFNTYLETFEVSAYIILPILLGKSDGNNNNNVERSPELNGLLCVQQCSQPREWTDDDIILLKQLANQISIALYQGELIANEQRYAKDLARSNERLEQFAYIASHDLQEPLQIVSSYAQLMQHRYLNQLDEKGQKYIQHMIEGTQRMQNQISDLLQYSRINTTRQSFQLANVGESLQQAIAHLQISLNRHQVQLVMPETLPEIRADHGQLVQLWQNLLSNAIKYGDNTAPRIQIHYQRQEQEWLFQVEDNGIGIEPRYRERIFQIFQRLHTQEKYSGTGIGLAICQRIVELHGGRIWVESAAIQGSIFCFTIPA